MDPLNFYQIADHACRQGDEVCLRRVSAFFCLPNLLTGNGDARILPTWRHHRSCLSAFASCIKGSITCLPSTEDGVGTKAPTPRPQYVSFGTVLCWLSNQVRQLQEEVLDRQGYDRALKFTRTTTQPKALPSISQLLLLVLLGRGVAAAAKVMLGVEVALPASYGVAGKGAKKGVSAGNPRAAAAAVGGVESMGARSDASSSSSSDQGSGSDDAGFLCMGGAGMFGAQRYLEQPQAPAVAKVFSMCLMLNTCISEWHLTISSSSRSTASAAKAATSEASAQGVGGGDGAAAAAGGSTGEGDLPSYLSQMLERGLPAAVVALLKQNGSSWGTKTAFQGGHPVLEEKQQQQFIKDVLGMVQVLMAAVPLPVGCNNPECENLEGASEATKACKVCTGCKIAKYCGSACQLGHWNVHMIACKKVKRELREQQAAAAAASSSCCPRAM